ncbi:MAG: NAD(P)H-dependent oxidoreductase [Culicoidibacterales bacterium]
MKILVIVAHPDLENSRVNKRLIQELAKHDEITVHVLTEVYPDGKIDMVAEQELLLKHDRIVFQYPFYWYNMPAILREWQDTVLAYGWAYSTGGTKLHGKELIIATSTGGAAHSYQAGSYNFYSMSELLRPVQQTANLTGMQYLIPFVIHSTRVMTDDVLEQAAKDYVAHITDPALNPRYHR